jgi:hypothetical protein
VVDPVFVATVFAATVFAPCAPPLDFLARVTRRVFILLRTRKKMDTIYYLAAAAGVTAVII